MHRSRSFSLEAFLTAASFHFLLAGCLFTSDLLAAASMRRYMAPARKPEAKLVEERAVVAALEQLLASRGIPPQVPKLARGIRTGQAEIWGNGLREVLIASVLEVTERVRSE